jgi:hypothetical protein
MTIFCYVIRTQAMRFGIGRRSNFQAQSSVQQRVVFLCASSLQVSSACNP